MTPELGDKIRKVCRWTLIAAFGLGYPLASHWVAASDTPSLAGALVAIAPLVALAALMAWRSSQRVAMLGVCLAALFCLYAAGDWLIANYNWVFLLQHAGTYALLAFAFGRTLRSGETPMITRFARAVHGELSPALQSYTRAATWAWVTYFAGIAVISALLFWLAPAAVWSTFANLLGLPMLALMFTGEYAVRRCMLPASDCAGPLSAIRAYRRVSSGAPARAP